MSRLINKFKILACSTGFFAAGLCLPAHADSLLQVYQQALRNDPTFQQAHADWLAAEQQLPIARAALLPNLNAQGGLAFNNQQYTQDAAFATNGNYWDTNWALNLSQPIFNWALWKTLQGAHANVKAATANYSYSSEDLIVRTVKAYLSVLQANDQLRFTRANKRAFAQEYDTAKQKFDVGLVPITDVYDSQAQYDQSAAQEIADIYALDNSIERLHEITGYYYQQLKGLSDKGIPLIYPQPNDINAWTRTAEKQNYQIKAQMYTTEAAKDNIGVQAAGHLPIITIQGSLTDQTQYDRTLTFNANNGNNTTENLDEQLGTIGAGITLPIYAGGAVVAQTQQAREQYASASAKLEFVHREVVGETRQSFLGVVSDISKIKADAQSIISSKNALQSAKAGYQVGTRTLVDVLDDTTQVYQTQEQYANDQYNYINNFISLKDQAGTLSVEDVERINEWLTKPIDLSAVKNIPSDTEPKEPAPNGEKKV